jgi:hypothetical protein
MLLTVPSQIGNRCSSARLENPADFPPDLRLVGKEIQPAIGDYHVHAIVCQRQVFDLTQPKLDIVQTRVPVVCGDALTRLAHHIWSHVHADHAPGWADLGTCDEDIETAARLSTSRACRRMAICFDVVEGAICSNATIWQTPSSPPRRAIRTRGRLPSAGAFVTSRISRIHTPIFRHVVKYNTMRRVCVDTEDPPCRRTRPRGRKST